MKYQPKKIEIVPKEVSELTTQNKKYTSVVMVNVRECGLDYMFYKHHIIDYQHKAGIKFRQIFENASIGGMKGRDFSALMTGGAKDKVSYGALHHIAELRDIHERLGDRGYNIACYICGQDYSLKQTRQILNISQRYMGSRLREVLDDLSRHFGYFKQKFY
tara:strand:+ start:103 stop:585 length:483 start_codon:yes stop_codon:yes gene_type:complete